MIDKCGTCAHARVMAGDLTQRVCRGGVPQVVTVPLPTGQIQVQHRFPIVLATDEACGQYKSKITLDHINGEIVQ